MLPLSTITNVSDILAVKVCMLPTCKGTFSVLNELAILLTCSDDEAISRSQALSTLLIVLNQDGLPQQRCNQLLCSCPFTSMFYLQ